MTRGKIRSSKDRARHQAADDARCCSARLPRVGARASWRLSAATGVGPDQIRNAARDPSFLSGVLDHFSGNEPLLIAFAQHQGIDPTEVERARAALGNVWERDLP